MDAPVGFDFLEESGESLSGTSKEQVFDGKEKGTMDLFFQRCRILYLFVNKM